MFYLLSKPNTRIHAGLLYTATLLGVLLAIAPQGNFLLSPQTTCMIVAHLAQHARLLPAHNTSDLQG